MQPLWRLSHNVTNVQIPFEITLNCNTQHFMSIDWLKSRRVYGQGWWEMDHDSTKMQSHLLAIFGVKNQIVCSSQVLMLSSSDCKIDTPRAAANSDINSGIINILPVWVTRGGQFQIVNHYYKKYRTQFGPLRDTGTHREPIGADEQHARSPTTLRTHEAYSAIKMSYGSLVYVTAPVVAPSPAHSFLECWRVLVEINSSSLPGVSKNV